MDNKIQYKEHFIDLYEFADIVMKKKGEYVREYQSLPKFIKIPVWIFEVLCKYDNPFINQDFKAYFCGLIICETRSIEDIEQVEIF